MQRASRTKWLGVSVAFLVGTPMAWASSHREAPLTAEDPTVDSTDVYLFRSPTEDGLAKGTVTIVADYIPFEEPGGGPNYYKLGDNVLYQIKIDNTGDAKEDIVYQFRFTTKYLGAKSSFLYNKGPIASPNDSNLLVQQTYTVTRIDERGRTTSGPFYTAPNYVGSRSFPGGGTSNLSSDDVYEAIAEKAIGPLKGGGKVFVGPRDDPFFIDLGSTFDLLGIRPGAPGGNGGGGIDYLAGYNVHSIVLQLPIEALTAGQNGAPVHGKSSVIGVWTTASRERVRVIEEDEGKMDQTVSGTGNGQRLAEGREGSMTNSPTLPADAEDFVQLSRLAIPLVNEVLVPVGVKDIYNTTNPTSDVRNAAPYLKDPELARLFALLYKLQVPGPGRTDLIGLVSFNLGAAPFDVAGLTPADILRIDLSVPESSILPKSRLGALGGDAGGFPNGRRLADDVLDIEERVLAGALCTKGKTCSIDANTTPLGDGVDNNDRAFLPRFPYLGIPWSGSAGTPIHKPQAAQPTLRQ